MKIDKQKLKWYIIYFLLALLPGTTAFQYIFEVNIQLSLPITYFLASKKPNGFIKNIRFKTINK